MKKCLLFFKTTDNYRPTQANKAMDAPYPQLPAGAGVT
jgi:hypothetical protein